MTFCHRCGKTIDPGMLFCPHCGEKTDPASPDPTIGMVSEEDMKTFLGRNAYRYLQKFQIFSSGGTNGFAFTWNWSAFFLGFIWMLYRKMYLWSLAAFFIALTPVALPLTMIGWGIVGNYIYFMHARNRIIEYKSRQGSTPMVPTLKDMGGVNGWVWVIGILLFLFLLIMGIFGSFLFLYLLDFFGFFRPEFVET